MALEIFKLVGSVFVDTDKANDSLKKVDKNASKVADGFSKAGKVAGAVGVAIGTAIVGAGTAIVGMANDTSEMADTIDKASIRMGIGAERYQELAYAAGQCGVEMSTMEQAAKKLEGTDMNFDDAMNQIMALGTEEERAAAAAELFGEKVAYNMAPLLAQSGEEFDALTQRANELGIVMSESAVKAGVEYGDLKEDLAKVGTSLKTSIGSAVMPILSKLTEKLIEFMPTIQSIIEKIGPIAADFIDKLLPPLMEVAEEVLPMIAQAASDLLPSLSEIASDLVPIIVDLVRELLPIIIQVVNEVMPVLVSIIKKLIPILSRIMEFLGPILEMVMELIGPLLDLVMTILNPILDLVTALLDPLLTLFGDILTPIFGIIQALLGPLTSLLGAILTPICKLLELILTPLMKLLDLILPPIFSLIETFLSWASPYLTAFFEFIGNAVTKMMDWFGSGGLVKVFKSFGDFFKKLWEGIVSAFKTAINFIIKGINKFIEGLNKLKPPKWLTDLTGMTGVNLATIPLLANGGDIEEAGRVIVGERGPEMLDLPRGARVTPLDNASSDYSRLTEAFVNALRMVAPELAPNITVEGDVDNIIRATVKANRNARRMTGRGLYEV